jgi:hypothetical protein
MAQPDFEAIVREIARETNASQEVVSKLYADTWAEVNQTARVHDFVPLFVAKRVKAKILDH